MSDTAVELVPGRSCQDCTLCCKLLRIDELAKPRHEWCAHCAIGKGCNIYEERPAPCRAFYCGWLINDWLGAHWQPARSRMMITAEGARLVIHVDPGRLDAWRKEPFYSEIKKWAAAAARRRGQVILWQGKEPIAILPDREKRLGPIRDGQFIVTTETRGPSGPVLDVVVVDADHPLARDSANPR